MSDFNYNVLKELSESETEEVLERLKDQLKGTGKKNEEAFGDFLDSLSQKARTEYAQNYQYFLSRRKAMAEDLKEFGIYSKEIPEMYEEEIREIVHDAKTYFERKIFDLYGDSRVQNENLRIELFNLIEGSHRNELNLTLEQYRALAEDGLKLTPEQQDLLKLNGLRARITRMEALEIQADLYTATFTGRLGDVFNRMAAAIAEDRYYKGAFDVFRLEGLGTSLARFSVDRLNLMLANPWAGDGKNMFERLELNEQKLRAFLHKDFSRMVITGESYNTVMDRLAKQLETTADYVRGLITTEAAFVASCADGMMYEDLGIKKFQFVATLDERTSEMCRAMDLRVFDYALYEPGFTAAPLHAYCRSTTVPVVDSWQNLPGYIPAERSARGADGKSYLVPADMSYREWEKLPDKVKFITGSEAPSGPVEAKIPSVYDSYLSGKEKKFLQGRLDLAPDHIKSFVSRYGEELLPRDMSWKGGYKTDMGAHYNQTNKRIPVTKSNRLCKTSAGLDHWVDHPEGVYLNLKEDLKDSASHNAGATYFHENGHNLDFIALRHNGYTGPKEWAQPGKFARGFSEIWQDGAIDKAIEKDAAAMYEKVFNKYAAGVYKDYDAAWLKSKGFNEAAARLKEGESILDVLRDSPALKQELSVQYGWDHSTIETKRKHTYKVMGNTGEQQLFENWKKDLMKENSNLKDADFDELSDILGSHLVHQDSYLAYPMGCGHSSGYWTTRYPFLTEDGVETVRARSKSLEATANIISAQIASPGAARLIEKYAPESFKSVNDMIKEAIS